MSSKPILYYFDIAGRAEPIRLAFVAGGIEFEDKRLTTEEFLKDVKPISPNGKVPMLEVDGKKYVETLAILDYACYLAKHHPRDAKEALILRMISEPLNGVWDQLGTIIVAVDDDARKQALATATEQIKDIFTKVEQFLQLHQGEKGHVLKGLSYCAADLIIFSLISAFEQHALGVDLGNIPKLFPNAFAIKEAVFNDNKGIQAYYANKSQ